MPPDLERGFLQKAVPTRLLAHSNVLPRKASAERPRSLSLGDVDG